MGTFLRDRICNGYAQGVRSDTHNEFAKMARVAEFQALSDLERMDGIAFRCRTRTTWNDNQVLDATAP